MQSTIRIFSKVLLKVPLIALFIIASATGCNAQSDQPAPRKVITSGSGLIQVEPNMAQLTMQLPTYPATSGLVQPMAVKPVPLSRPALSSPP